MPCVRTARPPSMRADTRKPSSLISWNRCGPDGPRLARLRRDFLSEARDLSICCIFDNQSAAPVFSSLFSSEFFCNVHRLGRESKRRAKSMHLSDQGPIVILVVGLIAGWLAGKVVRGNGFGLVGDAAIGVARPGRAMPITFAVPGSWLPVCRRFPR